MFKKYVLPLSLCIASLTACVKPPAVKNTVSKPYQMNQFEKELGIASASAADAQDMLARVKNATSMKVLSNSTVRQSKWQSNTKVKGLQEIITLDWVGSLDGVVRALSYHMEGWRIDIFGKPPVTSPVISVFKRDTTIQDILENIGEQLGDRVDVIVNPYAKPRPQIKFIYLDEKYDNS